MKKAITTLGLVTMLLLASSPIGASNNSVAATSQTQVATFTSEFNINGVSYTITLHDVSLWDCIKFKVASWFN